VLIQRVSLIGALNTAPATGCGSGRRIYMR